MTDQNNPCQHARNRRRNIRVKKGVRIHTWNRPAILRNTNPISVRARARLQRRVKSGTQFAFQARRGHEEEARRGWTRPVDPHVSIRSRVEIIIITNVVTCTQQAPANQQVSCFPRPGRDRVIISSITMITLVRRRRTEVGRRRKCLLETFDDSGCHAIINRT